MKSKVNYLKVRVIDANKFAKNLPKNLKNKFLGILYYDEKDYGHDSTGLKFSTFGEQMNELENNLMINNKTFKNKRIVKECDIYLNGITFKSTIIDIRQ